MDLQTKEQLVMLIDSGRNTYADIQEHFHLEYCDFDALVTGQERLLILEPPRPRSYKEEFVYLPTDQFTLADHGKDILYRRRKADYNKLMLHITIGIAFVSMIAAIFSATH